MDRKNIENIQDLEENWSAGCFKNFYFPHPEHIEESHTSAVYTLQYSGKYLISGSRDRSIRIWNLETQRLVLPPLLGHEASVLCAQFDESPEEDILISGGADTHILIWQFSTGKLVKEVRKAHSESVLSLRFNDRYLVTGSKDKTIKVWDRKALNLTATLLLTSEASPQSSPTMTLQNNSAAINSVLLTDKQIISGSGDRKIKVWDLNTGECVRTILRHTKGIAALALSPDGQSIISGSSDQTIQIFDTISGAEITCLSGHTNIVRTVAFPSDYGGTPSSVDRMVSGSYDGTIVVWRKQPDRTWILSLKLSFPDALRDISSRPAEGTSEYDVEMGGRVFNLQCDTQRIICCAQATTIVGWDFGICSRDAMDASGPTG